MLSSILWKILVFVKFIKNNLSICVQAKSRTFSIKFQFEDKEPYVQVQFQNNGKQNSSRTLVGKMRWFLFTQLSSLIIYPQCSTSLVLHHFKLILQKPLPNVYDKCWTLFSLFPSFNNTPFHQKIISTMSMIICTFFKNFFYVYKQ